MKIDACIKKVSKYLTSENSQPLIVDVQNGKDLAEISTHFRVDGNTFLSASDFCNADELPRMDTLLTKLCEKDENIFLTELSLFLKLQGEYELQQQLANILAMTIAGHVIVLTYQCNQQLQFSDPRFNMRICIIDSDEAVKPSLIFAAEDLPIPSNAFVINGINKTANAIETQMKDCIYVKTSKHKANYPLSLYAIADMSKAYDVLVKKDVSLTSIDETFGSEEQWKLVLERLGTRGKFADVITSEFGNYQSLDIILPSYTSFDADKKWLYFISLKVYGANKNWCLGVAAKKANSHKDFVRCAFRSLLDLDPSDKEFPKFYQERKMLLVALGNPIDEVIDYCKIVKQKGKDAIYYITDNSQQEKELLFNQLDKYGLEFSRVELEGILKTVYPDLHAYLSPFRFKMPLLDVYFNMYKYEKVINKILPEFETMVARQAKEREYNLLLEPRTAKLESIEKQGSQLYFMDAMGVEYLGFIMSKCTEKGLMASVTVCRSELPSITSKNKEFVEAFYEAGLVVNSIKDLDEMKHHGTDEYDYQQTKLPIHLIRELAIIEDTLDNIKIKLAQGVCNKAIMIADHGASRLAVIHETENMWEMTSKGKHSGRCCPKSDFDVKSEYATEENDFWVLANYDRFKGGRKANVEVHGGATLEEVTVPIIEITYASDDIEVSIVNPLLTVSFRKQAVIKLFSKTKLEDVSICVDGKYYDAVETKEDMFLIEMPQIKRAKTYTVDVYASNNLVASGLSFTVKKEGSQEKDLL